MNLYELNEKLKIDRQRGSIFNQVQKLAIKVYSNLSTLSIHYYLKISISIKHRQFFKIVSPNLDNVRTHCNDRNKPFQSACRKRYLYNIPHC